MDSSDEEGGTADCQRGSTTAVLELDISASGYTGRNEEGIPEDRQTKAKTTEGDLTGAYQRSASECGSSQDSPVSRARAMSDSLSTRIRNPLAKRSSEGCCQADEDEEEVPAAGGEKVTFSHRLANLTNRFSKVSFQVIRVSSVDNNDQPRAKATVKRQPTGRKHTPRKGGSRQSSVDSSNAIAVQGQALPADTNYRKSAERKGTFRRPGKSPASRQDSTEDVEYRAAVKRKGTARRPRPKSKLLKSEGVQDTSSCLDLPMDDQQTARKGGIPRSASNPVVAVSATAFNTKKNNDGSSPGGFFGFVRNVLKAQTSGQQ